MELQIKKAHFRNEFELLQLYEKVAGIEDGIIRNENEIDRDYISVILKKSIKKGLMLLGLVDGAIVAEIHAYTPNIFAYQHVLTNLTILVDPHHQQIGIGRKLFENFLENVKTDLNHILRIELSTREHNRRKVRFYESLGFINEGRQKNKIFVSNSKFETPLTMAWFNPNYGDKNTQYNNLL